MQNVGKDGGPEIPFLYALALLAGMVVSAAIGLFACVELVRLFLRG